VSGDKGDGAATVQMLCYGSAAASSRYARRDLRCAFTEHLHGVNVCLILDQFDELITCPIQEGDGAVPLWLEVTLCFTLQRSGVRLLPCLRTGKQHAKDGLNAAQ
jgi:hypothetical protein